MSSWDWEKASEAREGNQISLDLGNGRARMQSTHRYAKQAVYVRAGVEREASCRKNIFGSYGTPLQTSDRYIGVLRFPQVKVANKNLSYNASPMSRKAESNLCQCF
eukprot:1188306-Amphidinium_carterae.1